MNTTESVMRSVVAVGEPPLSTLSATINVGIGTKRHYVMEIINWIIAILILSLLLVGNGLVIHWILTTDQFSIAKVRIEGEIKHTKSSAIQDALTQQMNGNFFVLNLEKIRSSLESLPWIAEAHVRRVWPLALNLWLQERAALARWGDNSLISPDGKVFTPDAASIPAGLVFLHGPAGSEVEVLDIYHWLKERFAVHGLPILKLVLSNRRAWYVDLSTGLHLSVGKDHLKKRVDNFLKYLSKLPQPEALEQVDLRYANGFTARWRQF